MKIEFNRDYFTPEYYPQYFANDIITEDLIIKLKRGNIYDLYRQDLHISPDKCPFIYYICNLANGYKKRLFYYYKNNILSIVCEEENNNVIISYIDNEDIENIEYVFDNQEEAQIESVKKKISYNYSLLAITEDEFKKFIVTDDIRIKNEIENLKRKLEEEYMGRMQSYESRITTIKYTIKNLEKLLLELKNGITN